jgi:hypothetical protein
MPRKRKVKREYKTDTIRQRRVDVYLPTLAHKKRWLDFAESKGLSLSKFIIQAVENAMLPEDEEEKRNIQELMGENERLRERLTDTIKDRDRLRKLLELQETELRKYRAIPFVTEDFEGLRSYQKELVSILRSGSVISNNEILERLGIALDEGDAVKSVSKQLSLLHQYGLIKRIPGGWKWVE